MKRGTRAGVAILTISCVACGPTACGSAQVRDNTQTIARAREIADPTQAETRSLAELLLGVAPGVSPSNDEAVARLDRLKDLVGAIDNQTPRDTFDPAAVVSVVGRDPVKLTSWIGEHTVLVPYHGRLRGAVGVLMDRRGNSLDRSLLLSELLRAAGMKTRLARAHLTQEVAASLWRQTADSKLLDQPLPDVSDDGPYVDEYAGTSERAQAIRQAMTRVADASQQAADKIKARVQAQTASLVKLVGPIGTNGDPDAQSIETLRDHWWVQMQTGSTWVNLDPSANSTNRSVAAAESTLAPDAVPDELKHTVDIRVIAEQWTGTEYREVKAFEHQLVPSEVVGQPIEFQQLPIGWPRDGGSVAGAGNIGPFRTAVLAAHEWQPVLTIGPRSITHTSITDTGDINDNPGETTGGGAGGGLLGGLGSESENPSHTGILTAEWLEYEVRSPDQPVQIIRRELFDIAGAERRAAKTAPSVTDQVRWSRGLSLLGVTEILPLAGSLSEPFVANQISQALMSDLTVLKQWIARASSSPGGIEILSGLKRLPTRLWDLALGRSRWSRIPGRLYASHPQILTRHRLMAPDGDGIRLAEAVDIVSNGIEVVGSDQASARLEQGVLDSNAEVVLLGEHGSGESPTELLGMGAVDGQWHLLRTPEDARREKLSPDTAEHVLDDLKAGYAVIVPVTRNSADGGPAQGWWRVDPRTGTTLAMGPHGWGQGMVEYSTVKNLVSLGALSAGCLLLSSIGNPNGVTLTAGVVCIGTSAVMMLTAPLKAAIAMAIVSGVWLNDNPWLKSLRVL